MEFPTLEEYVFEEQEKAPAAAAAPEETATPEEKRVTPSNIENGFANPDADKDVTRHLAHGADITGLTNVIKPVADLLLRGDGEINDGKSMLESYDEATVAAQQEQVTGETNVVNEAGRAVAGAVPNLAAKVMNAGEFVGDVAGGVADAAGIIERDDSDIPWSKQYEYAKWDIGGAETQTAAGGMAQEMLSFVLGSLYVGGATTAAGLGQKATIGTELAADFVLDYFSKPGEGNLSNMIQSGPLANNFSAALAHQSDDNQHWRRFKNSIEGLIPAAGLEAIKAGYKGIRAGNAVIDAGGSAEEAAAAAKKVAAEEPKGSYADMAKEENTSVSGKPGLTPTRERLQLSETEPTKLVQNLKGGGEVGWYYTPDELFFGSFTAYDVSWDMLGDGKIGTDGKAMVTEFRNQIKDMEPGTVLSAQPLADDELGSGAIKRSAAQERAMAKDATREAEEHLKEAERIFTTKEDHGTFPMEFEDGTRFDSAQDAWDYLDDKGKAYWVEHYQRSGAIEQAWDEGRSNVRGNIYTRMGFGAVDPDHGTQYAVVRADGKLDPVNLTLKLENRAAEQELIANLIKKNKEAANGKPAMYEPHERAMDADKAPDVNTAAKSFWDDDMPGGGASLVDEVDVQQIKSIEGLREFIEGKIPDVDLDAISFALGKQTPEHVSDTFRSLAEFALDGELDEFVDGISFNVGIDGGFKGLNPGGRVVMDTLIKSLGEKIGTLVDNIIELDDLGASTIQHGTQLLDRAEAMLLVRKEASQVASKGLEAYKPVPPQLKRAIERDQEQIKKLFGEIRENLNSQDAVRIKKAQAQLKRLGLAMSTAKGDPKTQVRVLSLLARVGLGQWQRVQVLSMLSQALTHTKNIGGNLVRMGEQNLSRAVGGLFTDGVEVSDAAYAFQGLHESVAAAGRVGMNSFKSKVPITTGNAKAMEYVNQDRTAIESAIKMATSKGEKRAAEIALKLHDAYNHPWFTWPGKALQVGDDFSKTLMAHTELRYRAGVEVRKALSDINIKDPKESLALTDKRYRVLVDQKIKPNGSIIDNDLISTVEAGAFQQEVGGWVGKIGSAIQEAPGGRLILPFYSTPVNILKYARELSPLQMLSKEYKQTMEFGSQEAKAIMRGRMAMGSISSASVAALAANDLVTGNGPPFGPERDLWLKEHQPHSFRVGTDENGKPIWMSYQFIPGFSILWGMTADATNMAKDLSEGQTRHVLGALPYFFASAITAQPLFEAFNVMNALTDFESWNGEMIVKEMAEIANRALGTSGLRRTFVNEAAQGKHDFKNWAEKFVAQATGGVTVATGQTPAYPRKDILTGAQTQGKYGNPLNSLNPMSIVGAEASTLVETFRVLKYPITDVVPTKVIGVKLNGEEQVMLQNLIYGDGALRRDLEELFDESTSEFWNDYESWVTSYRNNEETKPREESDWYKDINRVVQKHVSAARRQLTEGDDPIAVNFRATAPGRKEKPLNEPKSTEEVKNLVKYGL